MEVNKNYENKYKLRTAAIIVKQNKILADLVNGFYSLPGGYVEFGETSEDALIRELEEELNIKVNNLTYLGVFENLFINDNKMRIVHEISFYYNVETKNLPKNDFNLIEKEENYDIHHNYKWISVNELEKIDFRPYELKEVLNNNLVFNHLVSKGFNRDEDKK